MVGQLALDQHIGVRLPASQPIATLVCFRQDIFVPFGQLVRRESTSALAPILYLPLFQPATRFSNAAVSTPSALPLAIA